MALSAVVVWHRSYPLGWIRLGNGNVPPEHCDVVRLPCACGQRSGMPSRMGSRGELSIEASRRSCWPLRGTVALRMQRLNLELRPVFSVMWLRTRSSARRVKNSLPFEARQGRTALTTIAKANGIDIYTRRHNADQVTLSASLTPK